METIEEIQTRIDNLRAEAQEKTEAWYADQERIEGEINELIERQQRIAEILREGQN
jgi:hypothetical protein